MLWVTAYFGTAGQSAPQINQDSLDVIIDTSTGEVSSFTRIFDASGMAGDTWYNTQVGSGRRECTP